MIVKLLTEHHLVFLSLKGGCRGSSESTLVKMSKCWKSHVVAHIFFVAFDYYVHFPSFFSKMYILTQQQFYTTKQNHISTTDITVNML